MKKVFYLILIMLFCNCKREKELSATITKDYKKGSVSDQSNSNIDSVKLGINFTKKGSYVKIKAAIQTNHSFFKTLYAKNKTKAIDSASKYVYTTLIDTIVPHWYNTPWDFNGHTDVPNAGEIACGYFVSTTLKHLGFNLNRYKMAQAAGLNEAKLLQPKSKLKIFSNISFKKLKTKLNSIYDDGVYFVGLDNHVGYVLIKNDEIYFLHSSYYDDKVMIELAEYSPCFSSNMYVFAEISSNKKLIESWILGTRLNISKH